MESSRPDAGGSSVPAGFDPAADLDLLHRSRADAQIDSALDFGPWWYAPIIAFLLGSLTLAGASSGGTQALLWMVNLAVLAAFAVHDFRRRKVRAWPRGGRGLVLIGIPLFVCLILCVAWGTAVSSIGYDRFVPGWALLGFVLTTALLLGIRSLLVGARERRSALG